MRGKRFQCRWAALCMAVLVACSCSHLVGRSTRGTQDADTDTTVVAEATFADHEAKLRAVVCSAIEAASASSEDKARIIARKPYFFKEYVVYPEGSDEFELILRETQSRTVPYIGEAAVPKQRFATELHRKKRDARADSTFLRGVGVETISYELRNGRWTRLGSLFVAEKIEENVNGEWVPVREAVEQAIVSEQEEEGWLRRAWSSVTGR